ncbi:MULTISPECIES: CHAP domain-containing protein [unclassified Knoellia]|uniref:CHAP domain-containing protein n=1 Tax=Knoellia altitudinis TaxID=3404795 RepID=UPI0036198588
MTPRTITSFAMLATAAGLVTAAVPAAQASAAATVSTNATASVATTAALSTLRQQTVDRANSLLTADLRYEDAAGTIRLSTQPGATRNLLSWDGSNTNSNVLNDFNGLDWCGYLVARTWTGENTPSTSAFPRIPTYYMRSQAWRTEAKTPYYRFAQSRLPQPGDVLVWQNGAGAPGADNGTSTGHVGVVTAVNATTNVVTSVEGNVAGDEINRRTYTWDADGPTLPDKHFMGHTSRE